MAKGMCATLHHAEQIPGEHRGLLDKERGVYRYDQLIVLQNTKSPAVLFEAGIIVNKAEELELASSERQGLIGAAMLAPVSRYCNGKSEP